MGFNSAFKGLKCIVNFEMRFDGYLYVIDLIKTRKVIHIFLKVLNYLVITVLFRKRSVAQWNTKHGTSVRL